MTDKNKSSEIKIYGKNSAINVKNFDSLDEFQQYYNLHKIDIDELSTVKLNRLYHINGYKITRRKIENNEDKTLCFRQLYKTELEKSTNENNNDERFEEIENSITELKNKIKAFEAENMKIKKQLLEIINVINSSN